MSGDLWFGCGSAADERPLWRAMLGGRRTRIVYWPFALSTTMAATADAWLRGHLDDLGVEHELTTWTSLAGHRPAELTTASVDLLFVGGGNTFQLLDHVRRHGFVDEVRDFVHAGGHYYGGSAGAVVACESIAIAVGHDANDPGLTDLTGLGLLPDVTILPHFTPDQLDSTRHWARRHDTMVLGLPETIGLRYQRGGGTVIGSGVLTVVSGIGAEERAPGERL